MAALYYVVAMREYLMAIHDLSRGYALVCRGHELIIQYSACPYYASVPFTRVVHIELTGDTILTSIKQKHMKKQVGENFQNKRKTQTFVFLIM